jgi:hypothetical protein
MEGPEDNFSCGPVVDYLENIREALNSPPGGEADRWIYAVTVRGERRFQQKDEAAGSARRLFFFMRVRRPTQPDPASKVAVRAQ